MTAMDTSTEWFAPRLDWFTPLGGWDAAARWNLIAFEWMAKGWKQWMELATSWPEMGPMRDAAITVAGAVAEPAGAAVIADTVTPAGTIIPAGSVILAHPSVIPAQA